MRPRRSARVFLFDPLGRVLLIRFEVSRAGGVFAFWLTPGGEIEAGETPLEAATREVREELGLTLRLTGPIYEERNEFVHEGEMRKNHDFFFMGRCAAEAPVLTGLTAQEIAAMRAIRWWSAEGIAASGERFFPADLVARVRALGKL